MTAAAACMGVLLALLPAAGHDQLWFLLMGQRWLHGATLYGPTVFDSNPPLIVWLSAIPVYLGEHLHLPVPALGKSLVLLTTTISAALSFAFLRRLSPDLSRVQLTWLAFAFVSLFAVVPARDLGQRDHLTAILCLPYVLAAALDASERSTSYLQNRTFILRCFAGLLAGVGICLKPHQALIPFFVELTRLGLPQPAGTAKGVTSRLRSLVRPEPPILIVVGGVFLALIQRFSPAYFTLALPTLRDTYWAIGHLTLWQLVRESVELHVLGVVTMFLYICQRKTSRGDTLRSATTLLVAAALAATFAYYLQGTGWYYQQLPAIAFFGCALALELPNSPLFQRLPEAAWLPRATLALALLALCLTVHFTGYPFTLDRSFAITSPDPSFFEGLPAGTPVAMITTSVDDAMMPMARYHLLWAQRTNNVWTLPALLRTESPQGQAPGHIIPASRLATLIRQQHTWMVEDLQRWRPELILVARCQAPEVHCQELEDRHDDLLAWFMRDPAFREIWKHYRYLRTSGSYDAYDRVP